MELRKAIEFPVKHTQLRTCFWANSHVIGRYGKEEQTELLLLFQYEVQFLKIIEIGAAVQIYVNRTSILNVVLPMSNVGRGQQPNYTYM
jgi:hypothetical protein